MNIIIWLLIGLGAGTVAKMLTKQQESSSWVSSLIVGIIGSIVGGFLAGALGLSNILGNNILSTAVIAVAGSLLVLFIYHRFLADKINLKI